MKRILTAVTALGLLQSCTRPPESGVELDLAIFGSLEQQAVEQRIVTAFEAENPGVTVHLQGISHERYPEKIQAMMVGDAAPDLILVDISRYDDWASRGVLVDVTDAVMELDRENGLLPVPRETFERNGKYFCAPLNVHGFAMYCNLDALAKAGIPFKHEGWTWDEIIRMAPRLSSRHGNPDAPTEYELVFPPPEMILANYGARLFDDAWRPSRVTANSPQTLQALKLYRDYTRDGYAVPPDVGGDQGTYQLFRDGRVAFLFGGRASTPQLANKTKFAWDVVPMPLGAPDGATANSGTGIAIWTGSRHQKEAKLFLKFYAGPKGAQIAMLGGRYVPVYRKQAYSEDFLKLRPPASIKCFVDTMNAGASVLPLYGPGYPEVTEILNRCIQTVIFRDTPVENAARGLQDDLTDWLDRRKKSEATGTPAKTFP